jgi:hypothetical protein
MALMVEAVSTCGPLVNIYQTTGHNALEDTHLQTRSCENLKSHLKAGHIRFFLLDTLFSANKVWT